LYVYDAGEVEQLLNYPDLKVQLLVDNGEKKITTVGDGFIFSNEVVQIVEHGVGGSGGDSGGDYRPVIDIDDI
jgi:hypothetical protein